LSTAAVVACGVRQGVAHEVHAAALPGGLQDLGHGSAAAGSTDTLLRWKMEPEVVGCAEHQIISSGASVQQADSDDRSGREERKIPSQNCLYGLR
jgi:hypothetical protein